MKRDANKKDTMKNQKTEENQKAKNENNGIKKNY